MAIARSIMNYVLILCVIGALSCAAKEVSKETDAFLTNTFGVGYDVLSKIPESDRPDLFRREEEVGDDTDGFPSWYDYIGLIEAAAETYGFSCDNNCTDEIYWDPGQYGCTTQGETVANSYCTNLGTYFNCKLEEHAYSDSADAWGIESIGTCDCPSGCMGDRGVCESGSCTCKCGYSGPDCSQIDCRKQHCNNRGSCRFVEDLNANTCICEEGYAGDDCSIDMTAPLPPIPSLFPGSEFSSKDKYGDDHPIFNMSTIGQFHVQMSEEDYKFYVTPINQQTDEYAKVNVSFYNGVESKFLEGVGLRIKGGSSRSYAKKSWKISVNSFDNKGDTWKQQKKIALKSASMTADYIREVAAIAALRAMGSPVQRISYATLTINGVSQGLYLLMEEPGRDEFVKSRFGSDKGRLYKCLGTFDYLGEDPELYREQTCFWQGYPCYGPQNDVAEEESFEPIARLMKILNISDDREFEREIHTIFDVEFFLKNLVAEVMTGNWDGIWNSNNYFLYYNTDGIFYYFRYDLDLSFGMTNYLFRTDKKNIWDYGFDGRGKILIERILAIPAFREIYADYMTKLMGYVNANPNGPFLERLRAIRTRIAPLVKLDYYHRVDNAYSYEEFETSLEEPVIRPNTLPDNHYLKPEYILARSIIDFLERRVEATTEQLAEGPPCLQ